MSSYSYSYDGYGNVSVTLNVYFVLKASDFDVRTPAYQSVSAIKNMADKRDAAIEAIASGASGTTVDKIKYLNKWLVENNCYNSSSDLNSIDKICHECVTALLGNVGTSGPVCDSYSKAFMLLCNKLGIECVVVDGYASSNGSGGAHMWNYVRMDDGKWYGVDVTWNDPTVFGITGALSGYENDDYLLVGNNTVIGGSTFADSHIMQNTVTVGGTSFVNGPVIEDDKYTESESGNKAMTVYFDQPYDWMGDMYVYYWSGTNSSMVSWPGKPMTEIGGGLWYFDLPDGVEYVIFNDGSQQTCDIPISADCKDKLYSDGQWVPCVKAVFTGASITAGADLTMNYYTFIYGHILESSQKYAVIFTMNDKSVTVTDYTMINGEYVFAFEGIAPQCMGDLIDASLVVLDANGQIVQTLYQQSGYSVKLNCVQLLTVFPEDERLTVLIGDMLNYGAAAQLYIGYKTDELVNADVNIATSVATPQKSDLLLTTASGVTVDKTKFASAGVWFDNVNKLYFKIKVADISKVTVTVNGVAVNTEDMEKLDDSTYIVYTDGIYATGFDRVYTVKLYENGTLLQTLEYSVRSYVLTMMKKTESDGVTPTAMANLAKTLYAYGKSAESYVNQ
jgi:hypothetical protein